MPPAQALEPDQAEGETGGDPATTVSDFFAGAAPPAENRGRLSGAQV